MKKQPLTFQHIIWDWNGTLLNDKWLCINSINTILRQRNLPLLDEERYSEIFCFPVKKYYEAAGFNFQLEPFEKPAMEFIQLYDSRKKECHLQGGATAALAWFAQMGCSQYLLSASETGVLEEMTEFFGITQYFSDIKGLDNHYAHGKEDLGLELLKALQAPPESIVLIGDTAHDQDVAKRMGIASIICTNGHFPESRLIGKGSTLVSNLDELISLF